MTYPSGLVVSYVYDAIGEIDKITASGGGLSLSNVVTSVEHYPWGPVRRLTFGNLESRGHYLDLNYENYVLHSGTYPNRHIDRWFSADYNGNITGFSGRTFTYDNMERVASHTGPDGNYTYNYDLNGNRNWHQRNSVQINYNYNAARTRLNSLSGGISETRNYDANGNTIQIGNRYFDHDDTNRFWRYREGSSTVVTYTHNAFGERQLKQQGSTTTRFVYNGPSLLHERVGSIKRDYIYLGGEIVGLVKNGVLYYVHNDHLGRPEFVTNSTKSVVWNSQNNAFENMPGVDSIGNFNVGFPGQYYDIESGTDYNYFRTYDSTTGRYLQGDPIGLLGGLNSYAYVRGNPVGFIDPLGLKDEPFDPDTHDPRRSVPGTRTIFGETDPSEIYNCHSDAWHGRKGDPSDKRNFPELPRWDNFPDDDMKEMADPLGDDEGNEVGDIVVFGNDVDGDGELQPEEIQHSATVTEVDADGNTVQVRSKEGQMNITYHHPRQALPIYGETRKYYRKKGDK